MVVYKTMKVTFSYTYYTRPCAAEREHKDTWTSMRRTWVYGNGLIQNALLLKRWLPAARMLVWVPEDELMAVQMTRQQQERSKYLNLLKKMPNVELRAFTRGDIYAAEHPTMPRGQMLRMSRYLPLLHLRQGHAVVVRDADSVLSHRDILHIKDWLKDPARDYLIYQELKMGPSLPMGGGIAVKNHRISRAKWNQSLGNPKNYCDELALSSMLPERVVEQMRQLQSRTDKRSLSRPMLKFCSVRMLRTRLACNGDWFEYSSGKWTALWNDSEESPTSRRYFYDHHRETPDEMWVR